MHPNKISCAPIYLTPQEVKRSALIKLEALETLNLHRQWVDNSAIFLNKDGSYSHKVVDKGSLQMHIQTAYFSMASFIYSPGCKVSPEEERLQNARRHLLVSILAHAWLWGRPKVLDNQGNFVAFEKRQVIAPQDILDFFGKVRAHEANYTYEEIQKFLVNAQEVPLHLDKSKWNLTGFIACLRWDNLHNLYHNGGPWCSCRLEKDRYPPPYYETFPTKGAYFGIARRFRHWLFRGNNERGRAGCEVGMTKAEYLEKDQL
ncbi:uncharacterized protein BKA55DRAFT_720238 [Fusarium redolens]|uniref:Uncharacterized protein n=1 Tax=Fusarium redolens TaxID=48865 RepID=A0A9P9JKJ0_FUSRE|nr:uncharacterized protein BKA55DRAFT_720238 [Fusarium redolens]KAH7208448.1 hypothetical protein BKA55DRAFT_720238 [Fusarium redolens]